MVVVKAPQDHPLYPGLASASRRILRVDPPDRPCVSLLRPARCGQQPHHRSAARQVLDHLSPLNANALRKNLENAAEHNDPWYNEYCGMLKSRFH